LSVGCSMYSLLQMATDEEHLLLFLSCKKKTRYATLLVSVRNGDHMHKNTFFFYLFYGFLHDFHICNNGCVWDIFSSLPTFCVVNAHSRFFFSLSVSQNLDLFLQSNCFSHSRYCFQNILTLLHNWLSPYCVCVSLVRKCGIT